MGQRACSDGKSTRRAPPPPPLHPRHGFGRTNQVVPCQVAAVCLLGGSALRRHALVDFLRSLGLCREVARLESCFQGLQRAGRLADRGRQLQLALDGQRGQLEPALKVVRPPAVTERGRACRALTDVSAEGGLRRPMRGCMHSGTYGRGTPAVLRAFSALACSACRFGSSANRDRRLWASSNSSTASAYASLLESRINSVWQTTAEHCSPTKPVSTRPASEALDRDRVTYVLGRSRSRAAPCAASLPAPRRSLAAQRQRRQRVCGQS